MHVVVGGDRLVVAAHGLEHVTESEQCADVRRACSSRHLLVGRDRFVGERGRRQRRAAQEVRLRLAGLERDRAVEALQRFGISVLFLAQPSEVEDRGQEIRRERDRPLQQAVPLRRSRPARAATVASSRIASTLRGSLPQDAPVQLLRLARNGLPSGARPRAPSSAARAKARSSARTPGPLRRRGRASRAPCRA